MNTNTNEGCPERGEPSQENVPRSLKDINNPLNLAENNNSDNNNIPTSANLLFGESNATRILKALEKEKVPIYFGKRFFRGLMLFFILTTIAGIFGLLYLTINIKTESYKSRFPYLSEEEEKKVVEFYQRDPYFASLSESLQEYYLKGYYYQFVQNQGNHRILTENVTEALKFTPLNISDCYFLVINSTETKQKQLNPSYTSEDDSNNTNTTKGQKVENYLTQFIVYQSNNDSIYVWITLENLTNKSESQQQSSTQQDSTSQDTSDGSNSDTSDSIPQGNNDVLNMSELVKIWDDSDTTKKPSLLEATKDNLVINMVSCKLLRRGGIESCDKPALMSNETYETIINGLSMYFPDFTKKHANIFFNDNLTQENTDNKTYLNSNGTNVSHDIALKVNDDESKQTLSTTVEKKMSDTNEQDSNRYYNSQTTYNSSTIIDPYTGRTLYSLSTAHFKLFTLNDTANLSETDQQFLRDLASNTSISLYYNETQQVSDSELQVYSDYWNYIQKSSISDPINNMPQKSNISNETNNSARRLQMLYYTGSGQLVASERFSLFDTTKGGIHFYSYFQVDCYYDNYCYPFISLQVGNNPLGFEVTAYFYPLRIYAIQRFYKAFSFLKIVVLNNIKLLSDLAVQIIGNVGDLVVTVLFISKGIINEIHNFWLARKEILYVTLNKTIWNLNEMLNFTKNMFPVIDQEMVQMFKDVMGNSEIELNSEYSIYYNKIQGILPILQSEYQSFQQKLPYVNISDSEIQNIIKTLESLVSENYDPLYSQMNNSLNQWGDQISHWAPNILQNISNMIPLNDIFTFKEAYTKLNRLFIDYLQKEAQQTDLVNLTANELRTEYNSNQNILKITYDSQRPLIIQAVNNLKSLFLQRTSPTNTARKVITKTFMIAQYS